MAFVAREGVVYLIDVRNTVLSYEPEGLSPRAWREASPPREQRSKHEEAATRWLAEHCLDLAGADEMYFLVRDAPQEVWGYQGAVQTGFAFNETADADAAIILLTYRLMGRNLDELSRWAEYEPVDTPFFSKEEFRDYAPEKAEAAANLWELHGSAIKPLTRAISRRRVAVVITRDKNLREACRMAGAVVDGEPVDDFYIEVTRAWREWNKSPSGTIY